MPTLPTSPGSASHGCSDRSGSNGLVIDAAANRGVQPLENLARALERSADYRVLRRLAPMTTPIYDIPETRLALFVDCETTGLDPMADEVIEIGVVPFRYDALGRIIAVHHPVTQMRQPSSPIPARITRLTGIDDDAVRGRVLDESALFPLFERASLVVAHNAGFDRPFLERVMPSFGELPWACSMADVAWREEGAAAVALPALAADFGFFYGAHRATDDCLAAVEILGRSLPRSGALAMAEILRRAAAETCRVWAVGAPFQAKETLKRRRYRWSDGRDGRLRCWYADVTEQGLESELRFLRDEVFLEERDVTVSRVTAYDRFSSRC